MGKTKKYWRGIEELKESPDFLEQRDKEFTEHVPVNDFLGDEEKLENSSTSRRDFLKFLGFSVTAASLAACETPVNKAIPYLNKPEEVNPGEANWYASTFYDGTDFGSILVKTREGRPIFIESNKTSGIKTGGVNSRIIASVLNLYDSNRYHNPMKNGESSDWATVDGEILKALEEAKSKGGNIRLLTNTIISPSARAVINKLYSKYAIMVEQGDGSLVPSGFKHLTYDSISYNGILDANMKSFGKRAVPQYHFENAKTIVSIGADFAGNWLDASRYSDQYTSRRHPDKDWMSRHYQFETVMSLTGSNADVRVPVKPSEQSSIVKALYNAIASKSGNAKVNGGSSAHQEMINKAAADLMNSKGNSLVVCGSNDANTQILVNAINNMLGSYGNTIDLDHSLNMFKGDDRAVNDLVKEMKAGSVDVLLIAGVDPVYTMSNGSEFAEAMSKVGTTVSLASRPDMTSEKAKYVCPDSHYLESWNDAEPVNGMLGLTQPTISNLYDTRQYQESLMVWSGTEGTYHELMKKTWESGVFANQSNSTFFTDFWNDCLHDGGYVIKMSGEDSPSLIFNVEDIGAVASAIPAAKSGEFELELYQKVGIGDGKYASNPWLQELPDAITKVTWDNYVTMAPADMEERMYNTLLGQEQKANMVKVTVNDVTLDPLPVVAQPGQPKGTIGIALGYGKNVWKNNKAIGVNAFPALSSVNGVSSPYIYSVSIEDAEGGYHIAATQTHHTIMGRDSIIKEVDLGSYKSKDKESYNPAVVLPTHDGDKSVREIDLYNDHKVESTGHRWGMTIDLNTCTGCGACVTACHAENNVPVVGKDEIRRGRDMHWLRIDRYYSSDEENLPESERSYTKMEVPESNPKVVHQPMMCQHCNHAPCETVCPVAATTHSNEGLNQMTYNRCIGTRYCANNCPYKVRRFNWFNYIGNNKFEAMNPAQDDLGRMVLNPDVVVRSRGVMEKCSMCVQRIQAGKLKAKKNGVPVPDGSIQTACSAACSAGSITFGDLNDTESKVSKIAGDKRTYKVLEEVGTQTNVHYQVKVRNTESNLA